MNDNSELAPSQESSNCKEVRKSIWNPNNLQTPMELYVKNEKGENVVGPPNTGPRFCLTCKRNTTMIVSFYFKIILTIYLRLMVYTIRMPVLKTMIQNVNIQHVFTAR